MRGIRRYKIIAHLRYWWTRTQSVANAIFGGIRSFLRAPHDAMVRLSPHYRWWHEQPHHVKIHRHIRNFSALVGFAVIFGYSLATYQAIKYTLSPSFVSASGSNKTWSGATDMAEFVSGGNGKVAVESGKLALSGTPGGAAIISSNSDGQHDYNSSPYAQGLFSGVTVTNGYTINHSGIEYNDPNSNCYHQDTSTVISGGNLSEPYCIQGGPDAGISVGDVVAETSSKITVDASD